MLNGVEKIQKCIFPWGVGELNEGEVLPTDQLVSRLYRCTCEQLRADEEIVKLEKEMENCCLLLNTQVAKLESFITPVNNNINAVEGRGFDIDMEGNEGAYYKADYEKGRQILLCKKRNRVIQIQKLASWHAYRSFNLNLNEQDLHVGIDDIAFEDLLIDDIDEEDVDDSDAE